MQMDKVIGFRKGNKFLILFSGLLFAFLAMILISYLFKLPLSKFINPFAFVFLTPFAIVLIIFALQLLDKQRLIIIDKSGVSIRKSQLPFSRLEHIKWDDIIEYKACHDWPAFKRWQETNWLVIQQKSLNKKYKVDPLDLRTSNGDILNEMNKYVQKYNLGEVSIRPPVDDTIFDKHNPEIVFSSKLKNNP